MQSKLSNYTSPFPKKPQIAYFIVKQNNSIEARKYKLYKEVTTIGRSNRSDICLDGDRSISRIHATVRFGTASITHQIVDGEFGMARSVNGILLNDRPCICSLLNDGDTVTIGNYVLEYKVSDKRLFDKQEDTISKPSLTPR